MGRKTLIALLSASALALGACAGVDNDTAVRTGTGAAVGAATGAAVGAITGSGAGQGAAVGATVGAGGGFLYDQAEKDKRRY